MKRIYALLTLVMLTIAAAGQTLNVRVGSVVYQFPADQTGEMTYSGGTTLTVMGKTFALAEITSMTVDNTSVTDGAVGVTYNGTSATVRVAGNVAQYLTPTVSGAHVSIVQSESLASEVTYTLDGTSADGEFYMEGSYKATVEFNGVTLTNTTPVYSGAAVHIQNGKRIKVKVVTGTTNTLCDAKGGSQKACVYIKGHAEFAQKGTLNVAGNVKHGIKTGEYMTLKNAAINITSAVGDGISCAEYFAMESGAVSIAGTGDDGIQCDLDGEASTGETTDHEEEDSGNIYISGGTLNISVSADAAKGIKAGGDLRISGGEMTVKTTGGGVWDTDDKSVKASSCLSSDGNTIISGGTLGLTSTGAGGKGINCDGSLTATGGTVVVRTSGNAVVASANGTLSVISTSRQLDSYTSDYKSSPKGIKVDGAIVVSDAAVISITTSGAGGEGIESKQTVDIKGGQVTINATDDAVNASGDLTVSGGYLYACSTGNDGLDANGNCYIKGGLVYAIGAASPEVAIDANSEEQKKLYVTGGTIVAIGGLERGASLSQSCYSASSWNKNVWYALTVGGDTFAFKTPSGGGTTLVVSGASTPTLKSGVSVSGGTEIFDGAGYVGATVSGGSSVSLSSYTASSSGGMGGR